MMNRIPKCKHWKVSKNSKRLRQLQDGEFTCLPGTDDSFKCKKMGTVVCSGDELYKCWEEKGRKR